MFDHFTIFCNGYRFLAIFHHFFGHNFFAVDKFGGCGAGSEISSTPGATEGCTGEIGEPRAWMHSKMVIKQRRMETKPHGDSEMEEWRVSDWMVNAPLGYIPGSTGISRSVASLPSTLHASSTSISENVWVSSEKVHGGTCKAWKRVLEVIGIVTTWKWKNKGQLSEPSILMQYQLCFI